MSPMMQLMSHEWRARMHGPRPFLLVAVFLGIACGIALVLYLAASLTFSQVDNATRVPGRSLYWLLLGVQLVGGCFLVPALCVNSVVREREQNTLELLQGTLLLGYEIALGKLIPALAFVGLMMMLILPLLCIAFLLGGIEVGQVLLSLLVSLIGALSFAALAIAVSSIARSTLSAILLTYAIVLGITLGLPVTVLSALAITSGVMSADPVTQQTLSGLALYLAGLSPVGAVAIGEANFVNQGRLWGMELTSNTAGLPPRVWPAPVLPFVLFHIVLAIAAFVVSARRLSRA